MTKLFTALFMTALAVLLITGTAYAEEGSGATGATADLDFDITVDEGFYVKLGSSGATIDTASMTLDGVGDGTTHYFTPSFGITLDIIANVGAIDSVYLTADTATDNLANGGGTRFSSSANGWGDIRAQGTGDFTFVVNYDGTADQSLQNWTGPIDVSGNLRHSFVYSIGDTREAGNYTGRITLTVDGTP